MIVNAAWEKKWNHLRWNAPNRGAKCLLTLRQYMKLAEKAGITRPSQIGRSKGKYQMSRVGDTGDYVMGNCRFLLMSENLDEMLTNGGRKSQAEKIRGRTKETHSGVRSRSEKLTGRTKESHKGLQTVSEKKSKAFRVVSPTGKVYRGVHLKEFTKEHGLSTSNMMAVCRGARQSCNKGWTGTYTNRNS